MSEGQCEKKGEMSASLSSQNAKKTESSKDLPVGEKKKRMEEPLYLTRYE